MAVKENELQIIRVYDAPVKLVWEAWTDLEQASQWWGPRGFSFTNINKDFRPGGRWVYTMHGPDGIDYPNITTYHEIEKYQKLVYDHGGTADRQKLFTVMVTFKEELGKTTMTMVMSFDTAEMARETQKFIKKAGGGATWDRFAEYLEHKQKGTDPFYIHRTFQACPQKIFDMWVHPEHFSKWMGPMGADMELISANVKEGGSLHYHMKNADGSQMFGKVHYLKIQPSHFLQYTQNFCNKDGELCKPPFAPTWPDSMLTTVVFAEEEPGRTRVSLRWTVDGSANVAEKETFHSAKDGMTIGWTGSFDKLEEYLKKIV